MIQARNLKIMTRVCKTLASRMDCDVCFLSLPSPQFLCELVQGTQRMFVEQVKPTVNPVFRAYLLSVA